MSVDVEEAGCSDYLEPVEILLARAESGGVFTVVTQTYPAGGGPPPHRHEHEDEMFQVVSGRFELFDGETGAWTELPAGRVAFGPRGKVHTETAGSGGDDADYGERRADG